MKNKILRLTSIAFIGLGLAATSAAQGIDIDSIASAGTGCAPGTVSKHAELLPDGSLKLDIEFSEYNVLVRLRYADRSTRADGSDDLGDASRLYQSSA